MFDSVDVVVVKRHVLEIIWDGKHIKRAECELRLALFINALEVAATRPECLLPFPHFFYDPITATKNIDGLKEHINSLPSLDDIKDETEFPLLTWNLLYWIFTNPLNIESLPNSNIKTLYCLKKQTKLPVIPNFGENYISHFKIITPSPKAEFTEGKKKFGTFFAYHGSKLENFHSIIHRGLLSSLNQRSMLGHGTYLTLQLLTAIEYARTSKLWKYSKLFPNDSTQSTRKCIAIVEVVDDPSIRWHWDWSFWYFLKVIPLIKPPRSESVCCVVDSDHLIQLSYLIVL